MTSQSPESDKVSDYLPNTSEIKDKTDIDPVFSREDELLLNTDDYDSHPEIFEQKYQNDNMFGTDNIGRAITHREEPYDIEVFDISHLQSNSENSLNKTRKHRASTILDNIKDTDAFQTISKLSWWDTDFKKERVKVYFQLFTNYILLSVTIIVVFSIYWGSYYKRPSRYKNFKFLVVNNDLEIDGLTPIIGLSVNLTASNGKVKQFGDWQQFTTTEFMNHFKIDSIENIYSEILTQIHHQHYWGAIYVQPNATNQLYQAISNNDTTYNVSSNSVELIYETGRDLITMSTYIEPFLKIFEQVYILVLSSQFSTLISEIVDENTKLQALPIISKPFIFQKLDYRPASNTELLAPMELGLTLLVIFAFFQVVMTSKLQLLLSTKIKGLKFILIRFLISQLSYILLSFSYLILNLAFQLNYKATFGDSGALVLWSIGYLTMSALGSVNEIVALLCFTYYPNLIGAWLLILMSSNVAPTISPMTLLNHFFRYGYAVPIHNSYELVKVVFSNTYKGQMGRNIGILVAWIILSNLILPFALLHCARVMGKKKKEAEALANLEKS
ncbi:hypothetical protein WICMUC_005749 [Wickerhamomyces mucosus]|uniref:DUF3533 domain-containing protein n=1 Tax=Wickerhamomyces mucosus TaxID=1378264 RepID=A0A9P8P462_9ASCO|nr:hypothetical protein WICMUC_005749 [Wickerhamomyces mucosus]